MRNEFLESLIQLQSLGYHIAMTPGTAEYYHQRGIEHILILEKELQVTNTLSSSSSSNNNNNVLSTVVEYIQTRKIDLVINIPEGTTRGDEVTAGYLMRRAAVDYGVSLLTNLK
jgi:carbamoyl-phosphate synthase/aspartate carbamoyltransferase